MCVFVSVCMFPMSVKPMTSFHFSSLAYESPYPPPTSRPEWRDGEREGERRRKKWKRRVETGVRESLSEKVFFYPAECLPIELSLCTNLIHWCCHFKVLNCGQVQWAIKLKDSQEQQTHICTRVHPESEVLLTDLPWLTQG